MAFLSTMAYYIAQAGVKHKAIEMGEGSHGLSILSEWHLSPEELPSDLEQRASGDLALVTESVHSSLKYRDPRVHTILYLVSLLCIRESIVYSHPSSRYS